MRYRLTSLVVLLVLFAAASALAAPVPSKTSPLQSLDQRDADLAAVRSVVENDAVAESLAEHGFTADEVSARLERLSAGDLHQLATNLDQLQAAGHSGPHTAGMNSKWVWIGIGVLAAIILIAVL